MIAASSQGRIRKPRFITSNNGRDEVGVVFGLLLKLTADGNAVSLLVITKQPGNKFRCNAPHIELLRQNSLTRSARQFDNVTNIVNSSTFSLPGEPLAFLLHFSVVVPVECRPERSSSSTNIRPFLKRLNHS
jgi:hypothetical protein